MKTLWTLPLLVPVLVFAELRTVTGEPRTEPLAVVVLATVVAYLALRGERGPAPPIAAGAAALIGSVALAFTAPTPIREAACAVAAGGMLTLARHSRAAGVMTFSLASLAAVLAHWLAPYLLVRWSPAESLSTAAGALLGWLGLAAVPTERGIAFVREGVASLELGLGWTHLGAREALGLLAGAAVAAVAGRRAGWRARHLAAFTAALAIGLVARFAVNVGVLLETRSPELLVDPWLRSLALGVPMLLVLAGFDAFGARPLPPRADSPRGLAVRPSPVAMAAAGGGVLLLVLAAFAAGPAARAKGRIAIDEGHSNWERLDVPFDRETFGTLAVYNYGEWVRGLERRYGGVERLHGRIDEATLSELDLLIVKTPTEPYAASEVAAIQHFVERGGSLYMVGDHNDVFGMNTILNSISAEYGIEYRPDALLEVEYEGGQVVDPAALPPHPLTRAMKPMHYMTSCSIAVSGAARPILWMNSGFADDPDYSKNNFIGDGALVGAEPLAPLAQLVSAEPGRGRVLAFSDSTLFSNFSIYFPGVRELAFGGVEWLLREPRFPRWRVWSAALGLVLLSGGGWVLRREGAALCASAVLGFGVGLGAAELDCRSALSSWARAVERHDVEFDTTISAGRLPIWHQAHDGLPDEFWGMFLGFQRSGSPMRVALEEDELFRGEASVLVWPKRELAAGFAQRAKAFVERGGTLYVFEDRLIHTSAANDVLEPFGLRMAAPCAGRRWSAGGRHSVDLELERSVVVEGGQPVLLDAANEPLAARARYGHGSVVAVGLAEEFSSASLGTSSELHGQRGELLMRLLYRVIDAAGDRAEPARVPSTAL